MGAGDVSGDEPTYGTWAGWAPVNGQPLFVLLTIGATAAEPAASLDLPERLRFRIPLLPSHPAGIDGAEMGFTVTVGGVGRFDINGVPGAAELDGEITHGATATQFILRRRCVLNMDAFRPFIGRHRRPDGQDILLSVRGDAPNQTPFYADGDSIVRLHPLSDYEYLSERCEALRLDPAGGGLVWADPGGDPGAAAYRLALYQEEDVSLGSGDVTLAGTLLRPPSITAVPAVVLMHGSSPGERDFYRIYADRFARAGIAAFIYDKRGTGFSTGSRDSTLEDRAHDAASAIRFLRSRPDVDADRVGLWAFSNGTWSAPMVASGIERVAFMVVVGAAGVSGADAEIYRKLRELRDWDVPSALLNDVARAWRTIYGVVAHGSWETESEESFDKLVARLHSNERLTSIPLADYAKTNPWLAPVPPPIKAGELKATYWRMAPDLAYDPIADYERIQCPVLFVIGSDDTNVPPDGARRVAEALERGGNRDHTIRVISGAGHSLELTHGSIQGMSAAGMSHELHSWRFAAGYLDSMSEWIVGHCGAVARGTAD